MVCKVFLFVIFIVSVMQKSVAEDTPGKSPFTELVDHYDHGKRIISIQDAVPKLGITYPGTKWCGPGNTANNYDDLGIAKKTDMCCRSHDNCDSIRSGETKYGLTNDGPFTKLHCNCDKAFYICLKEADTATADSVGFIYFNVNPTQCYMETYPVTGCSRYQYYLLQRRCIEYSMDSSKPLQYQWFDIPFYV